MDLHALLAILVTKLKPVKMEYVQDPITCSAQIQPVKQMVSVIQLLEAAAILMPQLVLLVSLEILVL